MRSLLRYTLLALPLLGAAIAEEPSTQTSDASNSIYANAQEAFQELLNVLPEESLQAALNSLTKFKAGVFESHRSGVEHVHSNSPALATKLIVAAVQDLKNRQVAAPSNGTTPVVPSSQAPEQPQSSAQPSAQPSTQQSAQQSTQQSAQPSAQPSTQQSAQQSAQQSSQAPENTQQQSSEQAPATTANAPSTPTSRPVLIPVQVTTVNQQGSTVVQTSEVFSEVTASVQVTVTRTTTNQQGSTVAVTTQEVRPAVIRTTTDSRGSQVTVTSAAMYAPTRGQVLTTTNAEGSTFLTTYTPGGGRVSSVKLVTTTDAEGRPQTRTSITYVDPTEVGGSDDNGSGSGATPTGRPTVQSGSASKNSALAGLVGLGAFAFFF
ncbi:uncharacterized protein EKO05_0005238 [Ascochyta rabiei]|uniref:uncharacterized protein n=1 Tax=Didymella rabiei TaxID=5454 RepID=UPI0018FF1247|nr:uncharacterized protein EKO05_0005238 [Ascochyta rabiei]UPX14766.1 hypothetical protein EKO05_0005238 [Ascochyta rabiei]